jgi:hypothetical protein
MASQVVVFTNPWRDTSTQRSYRTGEVAELDETLVFQLVRAGYVRTTDRLVVDPAEPYVLKHDLDQYARWDTVNTAADQWYLEATRKGYVPTMPLPSSLTGAGIVVPNPTPLAWALMTMDTPPTTGPVTVRGSYNDTPIGDITMPIGGTRVTASWPMLLPAGATVHLTIVDAPASGAGTNIGVVVGAAGILP